jgi:hypothetical protein
MSVASSKKRKSIAPLEQETVEMASINQSGRKRSMTKVPVA